MTIEYRKYGPPTAVSRSKIIKKFEDGSVLIRVRRWNCWGEPIGGPGAYYDNRVAGKQIKTGLEDHRSLALMQAGCCPPQLASQMLGDEDSPGARGDAIEEAYKLHKRGYLGGVG